MKYTINFLIINKQEILQEHQETDNAVVAIFMPQQRLDNGKPVLAQLLFRHLILQVRLLAGQHNQGEWVVHR